MRNPTNQPPSLISESGSKFYSADIASNFPKFFFTMACCWACLALVAIIFVRRNPELTNDPVETARSQESMLTFSEGLKTR